ncbi:MAG: 2-oxoglutarate dehydrogenase complex dihydrolipoyllysine-residue succinyltransferase [Planctomycetota bacterium]
MSKEVELVVPPVGESITEVFIGEWYVEKGAFAQMDKRVVALESDKATFDLPAPISGNVSRIVKQVGETAAVGEIIGYMTPAEAPARTANPAASTPAAEPIAASSSVKTSSSSRQEAERRVMPSAERMMSQSGLSSSMVEPSGPGGRILKEDVAKRLRDGKSKMFGSREKKSVPLSPIRRTIAKRLVEAQQTAALLTTFNEVDMLAVKQLRELYKSAFEKKYGLKLGFMSFFVRAVVDALQQYPAINAKIDGNNLVYHDYCDIGIAVGGTKGLVVPVLRNAECMGFADIEHAIRDFAIRVKENRIELEELEGGTFTVTNGGVYGSLLSKPIVNPPQSGVLGMHGIVERPIAIKGEVFVRPMMYIALTYDHRVVDGKEAVSFLRRIKEGIEDPARLILEV